MIVFLEYKNINDSSQKNFLESCFAYAVYDLLEINESEKTSQLEKIASEAFYPQEERRETRKYLENPEEEFIQKILHLLVVYYSDKS